MENFQKKLIKETTRYGSLISFILGKVSQGY